MPASPTPSPGFTVPDFALRGVVCALPGDPVDNAAFRARWGDKAVDDLTAMTGVQFRHVAAPTQTAGDLCRVAAERLLDRLDWARDSVDALILVTQTPDQRMPATACLLHGAMGLSPRCQAFDVGLGCSGYAYGVWLAAALIAAGCRRVLLLAGDTSSRLVDPADRSTAPLFGDAGSATALERTPGAAPAYFVLGTDGTGAGHLSVEGGGFRPPAGGGAARDTLEMQGSDVFGFTLRAVPALIRDTLAGANRDAAEVELFALHQANRFMLRHIGKKLGVADRMPVNIERFGNTSSASIPLLMATDLAARLCAAPCDLLLAGFGVGLSWGAAMLPGLHLGCAETVAA